MAPQWNSFARLKQVEGLYLDTAIYIYRTGGMKIPRGRPQWNRVAWVAGILPQLNNRHARGAALNGAGFIPRGKHYILREGAIIDATNLRLSS